MPSATPTGKQHRAMEAAAHGRSTLGIPKKVGEDFVKADEGGKAEKKKSFTHVLDKLDDSLARQRAHAAHAAKGKAEREEEDGGEEGGDEDDEKRKK